MTAEVTFLHSRRKIAGLCAIGSVGLLPPIRKLQAQTQTQTIQRRPIPHGRGETLPVVGLGTSVVFDVGSSPEAQNGCMQVVRAMIQHGGTVIDTAPSYGSAEEVVGDIIARAGIRDRVFIATKLEEFRRGAEANEARGSLQRLKTTKLDLLQLHNVRDPDQDMDELNSLKTQGICRYVGITTTDNGDYDAAAAIIRRTKPDFVEIGYAIDNRDAEKRVFPAAQDAGTAVLVALPLGNGDLFRAVLGKKLPDWAREIDCSTWAQFFLKFILGNPAVTAAIPGTSNPSHMVDDLGAGIGRLPDGAMRARMAHYVESL